VNDGKVRERREVVIVGPTGTPRAIAVAAIQESFTGIGCPASRSASRNLAHAFATAASTWMGSSESAAVNVSRRVSRVATSVAANTPARSSPMVMTETANRSGIASTSMDRPDS
jgi:hypothetical protein